MSATAATAVVRSPSARRERDGFLLCAFSAACFGMTAVVAQLAYAAGVNVVTLLTIRYGLAAAALWLLAERAGVARIGPRRVVLTALGLGFCAYSVESMLFYSSLTRLSASLSELLLYSYPAIVTVGAIALRREPASRRRFAALGFATLGVALVLGGASQGMLDPLGAAFALGAALIYSGYVLIASGVGDELHPLPFGALVCGGAAAAFALGGGATGSLHLSLSAAAWGWIALIALGLTVVAIATALAGLARLGPARSSIVSTLEPPVTVLGAMLVFGDRLSALQLAGGALVLATVLVFQAAPVRSRDRGAPARSAARAAARAFALVASRRRRMDV